VNFFKFQKPPKEGGKSKSSKLWDENLGIDSHSKKQRIYRGRRGRKIVLGVTELGEGESKVFITVKGKGEKRLERTRGEDF